MCGIVSYFGSDPDVISRIITGMSAIIYRAPDSTGIGTFGNLCEPIVMRKCLGSVSNLIPVLLEHPCYGTHAVPLLTSLRQGKEEIPTNEIQKNLILFEGLATHTHDALLKKEMAYLSHHDLISSHDGSKNSLNDKRPLPLLPGTPGCPFSLQPFKIRSRNDFRKLIETLFTTYNFSSVAVKSLFQDELKKSFGRFSQHRDASSGAFNEISQADIFDAFDYLFVKTLDELRSVREVREDIRHRHLNPRTKKMLWQMVSTFSIQIPRDFDTDGIRFLFKMIDAALLTGISFQPRLLESIQTAFESDIHVSPCGIKEKKTSQETDEMMDASLSKSHCVPSKMEWLTLYAAERTLNVYGIAAECALTWCVTHRLFAEMIHRDKQLTTHPDLSPLESLPIDLKRSDKMSKESAETLPIPLILNYLNPPMIGHGRWALQSSVTVKNAHPFIDQTGQRSIVLNGQFSLDIEDEMKTFLTKVVNISLKTENSGEYMALFWGYYYDAMVREKQKYQEIKEQVDLELDSYGVGSNTVNFRIFNQLKDKSCADIDAMAFVQAAERFTQKGGQIAVVGISMTSPGTLFAAASNRPLFIVKRADRESYMVVSDINAAMGLFSQKEILRITREYDTLVEKRDRRLLHAEPTGNWEAEWEALNAEFNGAAKKILSQFKVIMYALEGRDLFAKIDTRLQMGGNSSDNVLSRGVTITDFAGNEVHDITPEVLNLTPPHVHKDLDLSFFESHMKELPELLERMCDTLIDGDNTIEPIQVNKKVLLRKFGHQLRGLKRLFLVGMGSSYHTCLNAAPLIRTIFPQIQVICTRPVDISYLTRQILPYQDLALLVSWSGTTADMVDFAKKLGQMGTVTISITEKTVGDLALITRKSGGTVYAMSGEEVTVSAVKSPFCMMMATQLFALWLKWNLLEEKEYFAMMVEMRQLSQEIRALLTRSSFMAEVHALAFKSATRKGVLIVDNLHQAGVGLEAALKIEEMSWSFKSRCVDYSELPLELIRKKGNELLIIVNATSRKRRFDAMGAMMHLHREGVPFISLTWEGRELDQIEQVSHQVIRIPRLPDLLQPYVDLIFYYHLAFFSGRARGRIDDDYPRNRAKSVTTSRSAPVLAFAPRTELFNISHRESLLDAQVSPFDENRAESFFSQTTVWESRDLDERTLSTFHHFKQIGLAMASDNSLAGLIDSISEAFLENTASLLFDGDDDVEICFYPLDALSRGAIERTIMASSRFFPLMMRCLHNDESPDGLLPDTIIVFVSSTEYGKPPKAWCDKFVSKKIWLLPHAPGRSQGVPSIELFHYAKSFDVVEHCLVYAALMHLLLSIWSKHCPENGDLMLRHFGHSAEVIANILSNGRFLDEIMDVSRRNSAYHCLLYLSPPDGSGSAFTSHFDGSGSRFAQWQSFGNSSHGALVTVDSDVASKYIALESKARMVDEYGADQVATWEKKYLQGKDVDTFLKTEFSTGGHLVNSPFFSEGDWYLPLLRPNYDASQDNLIILNAANELYFNQAIDDLTVFGCRHARMVVISQEYFINKPEKKALGMFPFSGMLFIPSLQGDDRPVPLSDCHLPFAEGLIAAVMSDFMGSCY